MKTDAGNNEISPRLTTIFVGEIERQVDFALIALEQLQAGVSDQSRSPLGFRANRTWAAVQSFLGAAGMVSKLLWPISKEQRARGEKLRRLLNVPENSILRPPRRFRDHFEHYDERLHSWSEELGERVFIDANIGSLSNMISPQPDPKAIMRHLDPDNWMLSMRGDEYNVREVATALEEIGKSARAFHEAEPGLDRRE